MIIGCGSTCLVRQKGGRRTAAVCGLPSSHSSHSAELISCPTDLGGARQDLRNAYHLILIKEGEKYETELQYEFRERSHQQRNDV